MIGDMREQVDYLKGMPETEFSVQGIRAIGAIPWAKSYRTLTKIIKQDFFGENILKARIEGEGRQQRYFVKASNIINYLEKYGPALMATVRKPKQTWKQPRRSKSSKGK